MPFNSLQFIFLLMPLCMFFYHLIRNNIVQKIILFIFSLIFFWWANPSVFWVLLAIIFVNYGLGFLSKNKILANLAIILNTIVFCYFKNIVSFFAEHFHLPCLQIDIIFYPLGISFIMFHCLSYIIDIKNNRISNNNNFIDFALYISYFPKLIQGPIVSYKDFSTSLQNRKVDYYVICSSIERFIIGLAKKLLVADNLSIITQDVFNNVGNWYLNIFIVILYAIQIYMDFSAYSDMAISISRMFGINIKENFNFPYSSLSIAEFWRRWHMSLGAWFREYIYFPLGGSKKGNVYFNTMLVFLLTGIWHGTGLHFIAWGLMHGFCICIERFLIKKNIWFKIPILCRWTYTMIIVCFGWIVFNYGSMSITLQFLKRLISTPENMNIYFSGLHLKVAMTYCFITVLIYILLQFNKIKIFYRALNIYSRKFNIVKYIVLLIIFIVCVGQIISSDYSPFIYFQF